MTEFYIVSVKHTMRRDPYITVWRPGDCGYAYPLSWAGRYSELQIRAHLGYYNSGEATVAVPCDVLDKLAIAPKPGLIDGDVGPVVPNKAATWALIEANVIAPTRYPIEAEYRGARRRTGAPS